MDHLDPILPPRVAVQGLYSIDLTQEKCPINKLYQVQIMRLPPGHMSYAIRIIQIIQIIQTRSVFALKHLDPELWGPMIYCPRCA